MTMCNQKRKQLSTKYNNGFLCEIILYLEVGDTW